MEYREFTAKNLDDAITEACETLMVTSDRLDYEVVSSGSSGFSMLEPIMTGSVCAVASIPELTKPISMTVMADELWMAMVITAPRAMPRRGLDVMERRVFSSRPPAIFRSPWLITCIP